MKRVIVVHTTESHESYSGDLSVANYLQRRGLPVHEVVDGNSHIRMLDWDANCSAAKGLPKADGFHVEHVGFAGQTAAEWGDTFSEAQLNISAALTAQKALDDSIPVVKLTPSAVRDGGRGFCGHIDVTLGYGIRGGHWDPGPNFPWDHYLAKVRFFQAAIRGDRLPPLTPTPPAAMPVTEEDDMRPATIVHIVDPPSGISTDTWFLFDGFEALPLSSPAKANALARLGLVPATLLVNGQVRPQPVTWGEFNGARILPGQTLI